MTTPVNAAVTHQAYQPFPKMSTPLVDPETGMINQAWYMLLIRIWQMVGGAKTTLPQAGNLQQQTDGTVQYVDSSSGANLGAAVIYPGPTADLLEFDTLMKQVLADPPLPVNIVQNITLLGPPSDPPGVTDYIGVLALGTPADANPLSVSDVLAQVAPHDVPGVDGLGIALIAHMMDT